MSSLLVLNNKKRQILVIGNNENASTTEMEIMAYDTGKEIAKSNSVLITGGLGGVMKSASKGAHDAGGLVVGIIPQNDPSFANEFCDIVIPTGIGLSRDYINSLSGDGIIIIGGGAGTLSEMCAGYMHDRPMVSLRDSGGVATEYADKYIDSRQKNKIIGVDTAQDAVSTIIDLITT